VATSSVPKEVSYTLGSFKRQFLNKDVVVNDVADNMGYCLQWETAQVMMDSLGMSYQRTDVSPEGHISIKYRGQTGIVVKIQLAESSYQHTHLGGTNAFGESVGEDDIDDPYVWVVVRFNDGTSAMTKGYTATLVPNAMELASTRESLREDLESKLPSVIGRKLYSVGFSHLYKPTATIDDLSGTAEILARLETSEVPLLVPLTITKAKYLPDVNAVLMKLSLPNGKEGIAYTSSPYIHPNDHEQEFLARVAGTLLASIPRDLTPREISAIKGRKLFRGMSKEAVDYAIGYCKAENDWGRGGKQRVYFDGKLFVYLDSSGKVEDWQSLD
jgi:hypothetical protein